MLATFLMIVLGTIGFFSCLAGAFMMMPGRESGMQGFIVLAFGLLLITASYFVDRTRPK